jgi:hypothetical protein
MAGVRVAVLSGITGEKLFPETVLDCHSVLAEVRRKMGDRPSKPIMLFNRGQPIDDKFRAENGDVFTFTAVNCNVVGVEERQSILTRINTAHPAHLVDLFRNLSAALRDDPEIVNQVAVLRGCGSALDFASTQCFKEFAPKVLQSEAWRSGQDRHDTLRRIQTLGGSSLRDASRVAQSDKGIVLEALKMSPASLEFAGDICKNDEEVVLAAVRYAPELLSYAGSMLKNRAFFLRVLERFPRCLEHIPLDLQLDREFVLQAIHLNWNCLKFAKPVFQQDSDFREEAKETWEERRSNTCNCHWK